MVWFEDGKIKTELSDMSFFERILRNWAGYNEEKIEAFWKDITQQELSDEWLKNEGFDFLKNIFFVQGDSICLIKVGSKEWIVEDASPAEMEAFVKELT